MKYKYLVQDERAGLSRDPADCQICEFCDSYTQAVRAAPNHNGVVVRYELQADGIGLRNPKVVWRP